MSDAIAVAVAACARLVGVMQASKNYIDAEAQSSPRCDCFRARMLECSSAVGGKSFGPNARCLTARLGARGLEFGAWSLELEVSTMYLFRVGLSRASVEAAPIAICLCLGVTQLLPMQLLLLLAAVVGCSFVAILASHSNQLPVLHICLTTQAT